MQAASDPAPSPGPLVTRHNVQAILRQPGFRRLLASRLVSQLGDGWFQAGLAVSVFFNPEQAATPLKITAAFAVLLVPYSLLGPFVGVFLDRWSRRTSLAVANLARAALVVVVAACLWFGRHDALFLVCALLVVALNRFYLAGVSASLPHVVHAPRLVTANSFTTTAGTITYTTNLGLGGVVIGLVGSGPHHYALVCLVGVIGYLASAVALLVWFQAKQLGPDEQDRRMTSALRGVRDTLVGMAAGLRHVRHRPAAAAVLFVQAGHRLLFGLLTLETLLLFRNHYVVADPGASIVGLIPVTAAGASGALLAALVTPPLVRRLGAARWLVLVTAGLAVLVPGLGVPFSQPLTVAGALVVTFGAQCTKIVTDTTLQLEVDDDYRGRIFSVNDTGVNLFFVLGILIGAVSLPASGVSTVELLAAGAGYGLIALGYDAASRRIAAVTSAHARAPRPAAPPQPPRD